MDNHLQFFRKKYFMFLETAGLIVLQFMFRSYVVAKGRFMVIQPVYSLLGDKDKIGGGQKP